MLRWGVERLNSRNGFTQLIVVFDGSFLRDYLNVDRLIVDELMGTWILFPPRAQRVAETRRIHQLLPCVCTVMLAAFGSHGFWSSLPFSASSISEVGMRRLETLIELRFLNSSLSELILLFKLDKRFPVEQFEATVSQSIVRSVPRTIQFACLEPGGRGSPASADYAATARCRTQCTDEILKFQCLPRLIDYLSLRLGPAVHMEVHGLGCAQSTK